MTDEKTEEGIEELIKELKHVRAHGTPNQVRGAQLIAIALASDPGSGAILNATELHRVRIGIAAIAATAIEMEDTIRFAIEANLPQVALYLTGVHRALTSAASLINESITRLNLEPPDAAKDS